MAYSIMDFAYDEPKFKGVIRAPLCDSQRDLLEAIDSYSEAKKYYYVIMTPVLAMEFEGWVLGFKTTINKFRANSAKNLLFGISIIGIPLIYYNRVLLRQELEAKSKEKPAFFFCFLTNHYKYKCGHIGVNLSKPSYEGDLFKKYGRFY